MTERLKLILTVVPGGALLASLLNYIAFYGLHRGWPRFYSLSDFIDRVFEFAPLTLAASVVVLVIVGIISFYNFIVVQLATVLSEAIPRLLVRQWRRRGLPPRRQRRFVLRIMRDLTVMSRHVLGRLTMPGVLVALGLAALMFPAEYGWALLFAVAGLAVHEVLNPDAAAHMLSGRWLTRNGQTGVVAIFIGVVIAGAVASAADERERLARPAGEACAEAICAGEYRFVDRVAGGTILYRDGTLYLVENGSTSEAAPTIVFRAAFDPALSPSLACRMFGGLGWSSVCEVGLTAGPSARNREPGSSDAEAAGIAG